MNPITFTELNRLFKANLNVADASIDSVSIDSRTIQPGGLFVALSGQHHDGHDFVEMAAEKGAAACLVEKLLPELKLPQLVVSNTVEALGHLAKYYCEREGFKVIGITGSNGKTTVKEMAHLVLEHFQSVLVTKGNFNNELGVPLTIFEHAGQDLAVIEMGANHCGEIAYLSALVKPEIGLITCIGPAHLEGFGGMDGVLRGKTELFENITDEGFLIFNHDTYRSDYVLDKFAHKKLITFGESPDATVRIMSLQLTDDGRASFHIRYQDRDYPVELAVVGKHNAWNASSVFAMAAALDLDLDKVTSLLSTYGGFGGRLQIKPGINGCQVIDDTYNANRASFEVAIDVLAARAGKHYIAMGDMGELGSDASREHASVGEYAKQKNIDGLFAIGTLSKHAVDAFGSQGRHFVDQNQMINELKKYTNKNSTILIKGSRAAKMENIVTALADEIHVEECQQC